MLPSSIDGSRIPRSYRVESVCGLVSLSRRDSGRQDHDGDSPAGTAKLLERQGCRLWRLRVPHRFGPGYRMYFGKDGEALVILLAGGTKKRQDRDIATAHERWSDYKNRKARSSEMPLTREFKETVQARIRADRKYRKELLREGVECLLAGDLDSGKAIVRDYINATIGFDELSRRTKRPAKSLMRMLGPSGNPQARNLFEVIGHLQRAEGLHFELSLKAAS